MEDERQLIERLKKGELAAFNRLFDHYRPGLMAYVTQMTRDRHAAEDIVQETFVKMTRHISTIDARRGVSGWLYRVARNRTIDYLRRRTPETGIDLGAWNECTEDGGDPYSTLICEEENARLMAAFQALPEYERELLALRFFGGLKFRQIADVVGKPLGTVLWQARHILGRLRRTLEDHG